MRRSIGEMRRPVGNLARSGSEIGTSRFQVSGAVPGGVFPQYVLCALFAIAAVGCVGQIGDVSQAVGDDSSDDAGVSDPAPNEEPQGGCSISCHGSDSSNAPPKSVSGETETTARAVGAHQSHMNVAPTWHKKVDCADCHVVPADVNAAGHIDGDNVAEVIFSARTKTSTWNGTTCTTGCHGQPAWGGSSNTPTWTKVDGTQSACGSCHGVPPPAPHPTGANCAQCHPTMEENSLTFRDPSSHINGVVDVVEAGLTGGCTTCHGSTNSAPPKDLAGNTARTSKGVGAHQPHLATSNWHRDVTCSNCHVVPTTLDSPGHRDGDNIAEVIFDTFNPMGVYTAGTTTCSNNYCHGNGRGSNGTISWLTTGPLACNACHATNGTGMSGDHSRHINGQNMKCSQCHGTVVNSSMQIIAAALHVDGAREVKMANGTYNPATKQCANTGCHGTKTW